MAKCKLELRAVVPTAYTLRVVETGGGTATVTVLPADTNGYYLTSTVTSNSGALATIAAALTADGTLQATYALSIDDNSDASAGQVTFAASGGGVTAISINWAATTFGPTIQGLLGFTANVSGSLSYLGGAQATHLWLPNVGRDGNAEGPDPSATTAVFGSDESDYRLAVAPSGKTAATAFNRRSVETMSFALIEGNKAQIQNEALANESLQRFWRQMVTNGGAPYRYHPDRSSDTVYWTHRYDQEGGGRFRAENLTPGVYGAASLWRARWGAREYV